METVPDVVEPELEEAVLGSILTSPTLLNTILKNAKLHPSHFAMDRNRELYTLIINLNDRGIPPDIDLVSSHLNGSQVVTKDFLLYLSKVPSNVSNAPKHAARLVELSAWRQRRRQALRQLDAIGSKDLDAYARARAYTDAEDIEDSSFRTPEDLAEDFKDFLTTANGTSIELPFKGLNDLLMGGFKRKQTTMIGGWTSHGKSIIMDQFLKFFASRGISTHCYINEMGAEERVARLIVGETGIDYGKIINNRLDLEEQQSVDMVLSRLPFPITSCAGWSVDELVYDIKRHSFDVVGIDILHQFDYDSESELARISRFLNRTAKLANCHMLVTVHLNEARVTDTKRPRPVTRDIRGSGMIKNDADNVMMVFREQDPNTGTPMNASSLYLCKARSGKLGSVPAVFNEKYLMFEERQDIDTYQYT